MKESLEDVKDRLSGGPSMAGGIPNLFSSPETLIKLRMDPRTRAYMNDPSFVQIIQNVQKNPKNLQ
jgi:stress-induced-phosphoprotein 1